MGMLASHTAVEKFDAGIEYNVRIVFDCRNKSVKNLPWPLIPMKRFNAKNVA